MSNTNFINKNCIRKWRPYVLLTELEVRENEASKIFINLGARPGARGKKPADFLNLEGPRVEYGPQNWPIRAREQAERYNKMY